MKMLDTAIRYSTQDDAAGIAHVHQCAWRSAYAGLIPHKALNQMLARRNSDWWRKVIERSGSVMVAEVGGTLVGYATFGRNRAKQLDHAGEIYELYILPEYQGMGLGTRLFEAARHALKRHDMADCVVWALEDNANAVDFYFGKGGKDVAEGHETFDGTSLKKLAFAFPA